MFQKKSREKLQWACPSLPRICMPPGILYVGFCTIDSKSPTQNQTHNLSFQTHLQLPGVVFFPPFPILS